MASTPYVSGSVCTGFSKLPVTCPHSFSKTQLRGKLSNQRITVNVIQTRFASQITQQQKTPTGLVTVKEILF